MTAAQDARTFVSPVPATERGAVRLDATVMAAVMLTFAGVVAWLVTAQPTVDLEGPVTSAVSVVFDLVAGLFLGRAAMTERAARARIGWGLLALGLTAYALGDASWAWISYLVGGEPFPSVADGAYLGFYALAAAGLMLFPSAAMAHRERVRLAIDSSIVAVGGGMVVWSSLVRPLLGESETTSLGEALAFAYPIADLILLFAVGTIALRRPAGIARPALVALVAGMGFLLAADLGYGEAELLGIDSGAWSDVAYLAFALTTALAGYLQARATGRGDVVESGRTDGLLLRLPYLALVAGFAVLAIAITRADVEEVAELAIGIATVTALVMIRQEVIGRENGRLLAEAARLEAEQRYRALAGQASDTFLLVEADGRVAYASPSIERVLGIDATSLVGRGVDRLAHADDVLALRQLVSDTAAGRPVAPLTWRIWTREGSWRPVETIPANLLADPVIGKIVLTTRDIAEREALRQQVAQTAVRDFLTGLPNRLLFEDRASQAIGGARRDGLPASVLVLDIDGFGRINGTLGHGAGNAVLREAGRRLAAVVDSADTVARLEADCFGILVPNHPPVEPATGIADRVRAALREPMTVSGTAIELSVSIGIASTPPLAAEGASGLVQAAEVALARARHSGHGETVVFEPVMLADLSGTFELEADLRRAIPRGELFLEYQPIYDLATGALVSAEALVRWQHPVRGRLGPELFIGVAEDSGLIGDLGRWALRTACREVAAWARLAPGRVPRVAVNLSAQQLADPQLPWVVQSALAEAGAAPGWLTLEVTESLLVDNSADVLERLHAMRALGVGLAVDDFGTGYSALAYLQRYPIDHIKIDRSFVAPLNDEATGPGLALAVVEIARALGMTTIAEGIETPRQLARLTGFGCAMGQGFLLGRPLAAATMRAVVGEAARPGRAA